MMTSSIKDTFPNYNTWATRAGVVVGYKPEDTMKSFLFNQNNRHSININPNEMSVLQMPQSEIEKALDFLSSDSDSESSSITKITVKNASSLTDSGEKNKFNANKDYNSGTDSEIWHKNDNSDTDCTSADFSNEFADVNSDKITFSSANKSFEEIIEEKLQQEANFGKSIKGHSKSDPGKKPKFSFLRKNAGKAAWCSNVKLERSQSDQKSSMKPRSHSTDGVKQANDVNNNHEPIRKMKSMTNMMKKSDLPRKKENPVKSSRQKSVHFAVTSKCDSDLDVKILEPITVTQVSQKVAEMENNTAICDVSQDLDKELVEFELLEQIANVSISSSIASSIAMYDEENLREKLRKVKNMPPPVSYTLNKSSNVQSILSDVGKVPGNVDKGSHQLSTCEEKSEKGYQTKDYDTELDNDSDNDSLTASVNTTTLSEFNDTSIQEKHVDFIFPNKNPQAFTRKISKQNERHKDSDRENEDWIDENPFPLENNNTEKLSSTSQMSALKLPNVDWTFADPFNQSDNSSDEESQLNINKKSLKNHSDTCTIFPTVAVDKQQYNPDDNINMQSVKLKQWVQLLESEVKRFKSENEEIEKLKKEKEDGLRRLEDEMKVFQKYKDEETRKFEEFRQMEIKKLKKERKVFDDYQEAMKNMPNKKDRQEIDNLKSEIESLKEDTANKETRWQAANTRLKQKVDQLEVENSELHTRIHGLEQKRLQLQAQIVSTCNEKSKREIVTAKPKATVTSVSQAVSMKHANIPIGSVLKEDNNNNKTITGGNSKLNNPIKKTITKITNNNNTQKIQKPSKTTFNPFSSENGVIELRGSQASDYYTGEEESGSVDIKSPKVSSNSISHRSDLSEITLPTIQNSTYSLKMDRSNDAIKDEIHHPDGILERCYISGSVDVIYPNGSLKQISADSKSVVVHLYNGDIKQITPDGRVIYYYAQDESTQTTYPNGKEEIWYKNGHKEIVHPSGIREINFPDKSVKILHPDSREETFLPNGLVIRINNTGDKEILLPNGQKEIHTNGIKKRIYPDGTTKTVYPDGRQETFYASGRMRVKDKNGNLILDQYISKTSSLTNCN